MLVPDKLPLVMLPVVEILPVPTIPTVLTLPVELIVEPVIVVPVIAPEALTTPAVRKFPPSMLPLSI